MLVTYELKEWRNDECSDALEPSDSEDKSLWKWTDRIVNF